jgi:hypothetical protein
VLGAVGDFVVDGDKLKMRQPILVAAEDG